MRLFKRKAAEPPPPPPPPPPPACPYCGVIYDTPPTATRKCPECGNTIIRRKQGDDIRYLTEDQAKTHDAQRSAAAARIKALRRTLAIGLTEQDFRRKEEALAAKWGGSASAADVFWQLALGRIQQLGRQGGPRRCGYDLETVYRQQAQQLHYEHRSYQHLLKEAHKSRLIWEWTKIEAVEGPTEARAWRAVISGNACCPECARLDHRAYTFEEAMKTGPLPPDDCSAGWCNCCWLNEPPM